MRGDVSIYRRSNTKEHSRREIFRKGSGDIGVVIRGLDDDENDSPDLRHDKGISLAREEDSE